VSSSKPWRRLRFGLSTLLGLKKLGYFIPYRYAGELPEPVSYPALELFFASAHPRFEKLISAAEGYIDQLTDFSRAPEPKPRLNQDWFPCLDAVAAYTIVRQHKPARIFETGAGHSTRFFALAANDEGLETEHHAIDPAPRADLSAYGRVTMHRHLLHETPPAFWDQVAPGDIVSIDGSHILMPGTDVDLFLGDILPRVAGKALLHIHDICLPDAYPLNWAWRGYNEQNAIAGVLASGAFKVIWSSHYVRTRMKDRLAGSPLNDLPLKEGAVETSLWLAPATL